VSRESKVAILESILVRVQCRANEPRAPRVAVAAAAPARIDGAAALEDLGPPELIPIDEPPELIPIDEPPELIPIDEPPERVPVEASPQTAHAAPPAIAEAKVSVREQRVSLPPWPEPDEIEEPAPPSSPRLRDEVAAEQVAIPASEADEAEEPITLPPVSGRQHVEGVSPDRVVTLPPDAERIGALLEMDISAGADSAPPPPAAPPEIGSAPIELVESAEPPAVRVEPAGVRLMVEPGPSAPERAPLAVEVWAAAIRAPERAAASVAVFEGEAKRFAPKSIGEMLDATLALDGD
jgi:hypothetical protein